MILDGCSACEHGWRYVSDEYAERLIPMPPSATAAQVKSVWEAREIYATAVFPCPSCRPLAFARWANGCFGPDHRASKCDLCLEAVGEKSAARSDRAAVRAGARPEDF